jgi:flagellar M-ring protein FliF
MDFSTSERQEESFDPAGQVLRSERSVSEGSGDSARGGVPGVVSNLTNDPNLLAPRGTGDSSSSRSENVRNYEVSKAVTKSVSPRGNLVRLSVAVLVDGSYETKPAAAEGGAPEKVFKPIDPEMLAQIENVAKSAVGFDSARGDTLTVENVAFYSADTNIEEALDSKATQDLIFNVLFKAGPILFLVLFFFVIVRPIVKFLITPTEAEVDLSRLLPSGVQELENELETERSKAALPTFEPAVDLEQLEELMAENSRIVKENPRQAALLIRYWLNDGRL